MGREDDVMAGDGMRFRGTPARGLAGATTGFFFGAAAVALYGPTAARFGTVLALSPTLVGLLASIPMLTGSLLRIPFGAWCESTGGRKPFLVLLGLSLVGMCGLTAVLYTMSPSSLDATWYPVLLGFGGLAGCGIATFSVGITQVAYWFPPERRGMALGVFAALAAGSLYLVRSLDRTAEPKRAHGDGSVGSR